MNSVYPDNIGFKLTRKDFSISPSFKKNNLPKKTIIRIYGLSGVGKGRLSANLSSALNIPNLDTGKVFRAVCYVYIDQKFEEINPDNTLKVFNSLSFKIVNNQLQILYKNKELTTANLKSTIIDANITNYSKHPNLRQQTYDLILNLIVNKIDTACLTDARGASEDYIDKAEAMGYKIIRILVDVDFDTKLSRYYEENKYAKERELGRTLRVDEREKLYKQLWKVMKERDSKDLEISKSGQWQLISADSAILDTGEYNIQDGFHLVLNYILSLGA